MLKLLKSKLIYYTWWINPRRYASWDDKGNLTYRTWPEGGESFFRYDDVGNNTYWSSTRAGKADYPAQVVTRFTNENEKCYERVTNELIDVEYWYDPKGDLIQRLVHKVMVDGVNEANIL